MPFPSTPPRIPPPAPYFVGRGCVRRVDDAQGHCGGERPPAAAPYEPHHRRIARVGGEPAPPREVLSVAVHPSRTPPPGPRRPVLTERVRLTIAAIFTAGAVACAIAIGSSRGLVPECRTEEPGGSRWRVPCEE